MNKQILSLLFCVVVLLLVSGCAEEKASTPENDSAQHSPQEIQEIQQPAPASSEEKPTTPTQEDQAIVPEMNENQDERTIINEDTPPVLKNLAINMGPWNRQTNLAGDLVFSKKLLFNDGFINNEKAFLEFGEFDHMINNPDRSVEYWWFLSPGTKVRAPADGVVSVGFFEHTKDWGVGIAKGGWTSYGAPIGSKWIIGHEHLVNLEVKDGDIVKAGDILGEAAPRTFPGEDFGFTELSVWTGGATIFKYCPFEFLDESLKPVYEGKINQLAKDWEEFIGKDVYKQEDWVAPGCLLHNITER